MAKSKVVDNERARAVLASALEVARNAEPVPVEWTSYSRSVFSLKAKSWTPGFATMLLAKATNGNVDAFSIKVDPQNIYSYSMRGLCHGVVVPASVENQFSIRTTGPEPINNQPFFRYSRVDELDRVRAPADRDFFVEVTRRVNELMESEASAALAAFLRVAVEESARVRKVRVETGRLTPDSARVATVDFLRRDAPDRPQRLQAFAAACLELVFPDVRSRRINDPSRDVPGDVQAFDGDVVILAVEVRGKPVSQAGLQTFVRAIAEAGVYRAILFVDADGQKHLDVRSAIQLANAINQVHVATFMSVSELLGDVFLWTDRAEESAAKLFAEGLLKHLKLIEVAPTSVEEWARAISVAQGRL